MKKILLTIFLLLTLLIVAVYSVGSYFLEDNFVTNDAAPLSDPHTTEPGGQSIDAVETDGTMAIANGKLTFTAQSSPVDGDLGLRYATDMPDYMGRAMFYKLKFNSLANGITRFSNASELFGTTGVASDTFGTVYRRGFGTNATYFIGWTSSNVTHDFNFLTMPNTTDSFYVAVILGGSTDANSGASSPTWYLGQSAVPDSDGCFYFVKRNAIGKWLLQGRSYGEEQTADVFPIITNYNGAFSVDRWAASNDTLRDGYLSPVHLQRMTGTNGTQLFDDTPEVGTAYDSISSDWQFTADNRIHPIGATPADPYAHFTTCTTSDDDVFIEGSPTLRNADDADAALVFRYKASPLSFIMMYLTEGGTSMSIYTWEPSAFTQRATVGSISFPATDTPTYLAGAVYDSAGTTIMRCWYEAAAGAVFNLRYTHSSNFNSGATKHGIRIGGPSGANAEWDEVRIYPLGTDDEFIGLDAYFAGAAGAAARRRWIVQ